MKILVAGATGVIGRRLIQRLTGNGHDVVGLVRRPEEIERIRRFGAEPVQVDVFDRGALQAILDRVRPAAVIDELTSLPKSPADLNNAFPADRRLRIEGGGNLLAAAEDVGVERYIQQSSGFYLAAREGELADEQTPLRTDAPGVVGASATMYAQLEQRLLGSSRLSGIALRYGFFYGPETWYWADGAVAEQARRRHIQIVGNGTGVWSFVHVDDAVTATLAALDAAPGVYNVVDDDPEPVARWLPAFARWAGAPEPVPVSAEDAVKLVGTASVYLQTRLTGTSNHKAKAVLAFNPRPLVWMGRRHE